MKCAPVVRALRAESFALEHDPVEPADLAEAERTIGDAAQAVGATLDAPEDTSRLMGACEAIVVAQIQDPATSDPV